MPEAKREHEYAIFNANIDWKREDTNTKQFNLYPSDTPLRFSDAISLYEDGLLTSRNSVHHEALLDLGQNIKDAHDNVNVFYRGLVFSPIRDEPRPVMITGITIVSRHSDMPFDVLSRLNHFTRQRPSPSGRLYLSNEAINGIEYCSIATHWWDT